MPFDLSALARQARQAAEEGVGRFDEIERRRAAALAELRRQDEVELAARVSGRTNPPWLAGVPLGPPAEIHAAPTPPSDYTVVSTDGSHLDQDHHAALPHWLINVGTAMIRYGRDSTAQLTTQTQLGFRPEDLWFIHDERRLRVEGQLLNVRRQVAEMAALADLCVAYPGAVGLIDGSLLLTSISRSIQAEPTYFLETYLAHLERIRAAGSLVASYISRPGGADVVGALRFGCCPEGVCDRVCRLAEPSDRACAQLAEVPDRALFDALPLAHGARGGVWRSTWPVSDRHYGDHAVHFFYLDADAEIARIEVPGWIGRDAAALDRLHGVLIGQSRRGEDGYPRVLIEAHHKAVITAGDRRAFETLLDQSLAGRGFRTRASAKQRAKRGRAV